MKQIETEKQMPYITSIERLAKNEGKLEGKREGKIGGQDSITSRLAWFTGGIGCGN
ncbi:MAG: hypothetical protein R3C05_05235 [Pirellulaceae bacterium]